jgi:hypothetical protein
VRIIEGGNLSSARAFAYPIAVNEDVEYRGTDFSQDVPHTDDVFAVAAGVRLVLKGCNLVNVKVPDGAEIKGGNLSHGVLANTGDATRPQVRLLCECSKCATALAELQDRIAAGTLPKDESGMVDHSAMKAHYTVRRADSAKVTADRTRSANGNAAAMSRFGRTVTSQLQTSLGRGT